MKQQPDDKAPITESLICLRCSDITLQLLPTSGDGISFFDCPSCKRSYAKKDGGSLTFRWRHPITIALYNVIFEDEPLPYAIREAGFFMEGRPREILIRMVEEIELELDYPTQEIREALDNRATEEKCREYLRAFVSHIRSRL